MVGGGAVGGPAVTLVSVGQAALMAGRDERTIRRWITQGLLAEHQTAAGRRVVLQDAMRVESRMKRDRRRRAAEHRAAMIMTP